MNDNDPLPDLRPIDLRPIDLIAKIAGVSISNTIKVIKSINVISDALDIDISTHTLTLEKPTPAQALACERAYQKLRRAGLLKDVRNLTHASDP